MKFLHFLPSSDLTKLQKSYTLLVITYEYNYPNYDFFKVSSLLHSNLAIPLSNILQFKF